MKANAAAMKYIMEKLNEVRIKKIEKLRESCPYLFARYAHTPQEVSEEAILRAVAFFINKGAISSNRFKKILTPEKSLELIRLVLSGEYISAECKQSLIPKEVYDSMWETVIVQRSTLIKNISEIDEAYRQAEQQVYLGDKSELLSILEQFEKKIAEV